MGNQAQATGPIAPPAVEQRPVYVFIVPDHLKCENIVQQSVGLVKLSPEEELKASKRAGENAYALAFELAKASLYKVDGRRINIAEAEDELVWKKIDPELRQLILTAYNKLHSPEEKVAKDFLDGMKMTVG